ncbi:hypothetical protein D3C80_1240430 [compost metagenome]
MASTSAILRSGNSKRPRISCCGAGLSYHSVRQSFVPRTRLRERIFPSSKSRGSCGALRYKPDNGKKYQQSSALVRATDTTVSQSTSMPYGSRKTTPRTPLPIVPLPRHVVLSHIRFTTSFASPSRIWTRALGNFARVDFNPAILTGSISTSVTW